MIPTAPGGPHQNLAVDHLLRKLESERRPIRVGLIGAGTTGRAVALQLGLRVPGIRLAGIANRTAAHAERALHEAGLDRVGRADTARAAAAHIEAARVVLTEDWRVLTRCDAIDIVVEVTGTVAFAAEVVLDAIEHRKDVVMVNAGLDSLVGPILKARADAAGVVLTHTDGDEPGVAMTLLRYLQSLGLKPVAAGNIKGMVDHYRTPDTQRAFAEKVGQDAQKVASFADATKLSMETCVLANATGFGVGRRGMFGPACSDVRELARLLPAEALLGGGIVDYCVGAAPHTGAFVVVHETNRYQRAQFEYFKLGDGPFYVFYTPYHLPHMQLMSTIGRAALHGDATAAPLGAPSCEVVAVAKRDLRVGERLDGPGGFCSYGLIDNRAAARAMNALPMAMSEGCVLRRAVPKDRVISFEDVERAPRTLVDDLWDEQLRRWTEPDMAKDGPARALADVPSVPGCTAAATFG